MTPVVFALPENEFHANKILAGTFGEKGEYSLRKFPDGETYLRILSNVEQREVIVVCTLHEPDNKLLALLFFCRLLKDLKAKSICLVSPYLAYMRQDKKFNTGEAVTSGYFATLLSSFADQLITIDPHLHRRSSLQEIYTIPCSVLHAAGLISGWIKTNIPNALLVGPDGESRQWVSEVAKDAGVPFIVLNKIRQGDREVELSIPKTEDYKNYTPVLVDDIISTASTMIKAIQLLKQAGMNAPICIGVHPVFAPGAFQALKQAGAKEIISCNTIGHETNKIDISEMILSACKNILATKPLL